MVNVAIAGGTGQVALEVIDALIATGKHSITILSRATRPTNTPLPSTIKWQSVDYTSTASLTSALQGIHTLLSFIQPLSDIGQTSQKALIHACISAGVKRFAPSEYGSAGLEGLPWWSGKQLIRDYLHEINTPVKKLEYTLFTPGLFTNYLAYPLVTTRHLSPLQTTFDFEHRRAIMVEGHDPVMTLTSVQDFAAIVAEAVDSPDEIEWPVIGGIRGSWLKFSEIIKIGERVRGKHCLQYRCT
jgi:uncharacterized protein YbjT (DUF2867 family)